MAEKKTGVAMEDQNTDDNAFRNEKSLSDDDTFRNALEKPFEPQVVVPPRFVGIAEVLMLFVGVVELVALPTATPEPDFFAAVGIGCCLSLPAMLAVWSSIRLGVWRYSLTVVLSLLNGFMLTWWANQNFELLLVLLPLASALPVLLTLLIIKLLFGHFARFAPDSDQFLEGLRFNLSHIFIVTTVLAMLLPIGQFVWPMQTNNLAHRGVLMIVSCISVLISFNTLMFVWALLGKQVFLRICLAIPVGLVTSLICIKFCNARDDELIWAIVLGLPLLSSLLLMAALRFSGWRFFQGTTS